MHIRPCPVEDLRQLIPIGDVFEIQLLDRGAGDDEAVELAVCHFFPGLVESDQVVSRGILGRVIADADQRQFHLQRRGAKQARDLRLRADLVRHQVQEADLQRADVLARRL